MCDDTENKSQGSMMPLATACLHSTPMNRRAKGRHRFSHEGKLTWLTVGAAAPAIIIALSILWFGDFSAKVQWTLTIVIIGCALGFISSAREHIVHPLQTMTN